MAGAALGIGAACGGGGGGGGGGGSGPPYTVAGTIPAAAGTAADSDVNDPSAPFAPNDSAALAQEIPNPVALGGHVNVADAKPLGARDGRTTVAGDVEDWFRVSIAAGQTIRLLIAEDGSTNDLDLELRRLDGSSDPEGVLIPSSDTASRTEEIIVEDTGEYLVVVFAQAGFSNYTLTIGQSPTSAGTGGPMSPEFVPGEVIVRYREDLRGSLAAMAPAARASSVGMRHRAGRADGPMLFAYERPEERRAAFRALGIEAEPGVRSVPRNHDDATLRDDTLRLVEALRRRPEIRSADLNYLRAPSAMPADEFFPLQWHYDQINLPQAWDVVSDPSDVIVAVVDTGIKAHPDLGGQVVAGYDFISSTIISNDGDGCDADPEDPGDLAPGGSSYHGTHVAGTVAARTSLQTDGDAEGVAGVAWNARIMPLRVLGVGGGTDFDIMEALRYAAGRPNACGVLPADAAQIVNLSLGGSGFNQGFQDLITELRNQEGMIFVAAAGNESTSAPSYPAAFSGVISVSAVGPTKALAPYSNFGPTIDVAAPGGDFSRDVDSNGFPDGVLSTLFDPTQAEYVYAFFQGTSMAAPHVSGVIALMLGINPDLTPADIDNALNLGQITENVGSAAFFGNGLIDAVKAVNKAAEGGGGGVLLPALRVDPDGLNYGLLAQQFIVSASNVGNDEEPLRVLDVTFTSDDGAEWLTVTPDAVDAEGLGSYRATIDRAGLADGLYTGTLHFDADADVEVDDVDVPVIMQVGDAVNAEANAGHHYVLLVEPGTLVTVDSFEADSANGSYPIDFRNVDPGEYLVIAGTDSDNDFVICDAGEACGAFPTAESAVPILVDRDRNNIAFVTGFDSNVGAASTGGSAAGGFSRQIGERAP